MGVATASLDHAGFFCHRRTDRGTLYLHPQGIFPDSGHRYYPGHFRSAAKCISFWRWLSISKNLAKLILEDPAVDSLSSFIGVDGINTTPNSGRFLINLKPHAERTDNATEVITRLKSKLAELSGVTLYLQPVQDLTMENRVSRTQYQFTLETPDAEELNRWTLRLVEHLTDEPEFSDVTSDVQDQGQQVYVNIDRSTASRLGITTAAVDNTLYSAYRATAGIDHFYPVEPIPGGA